MKLREDALNSYLFAGYLLSTSEFSWLESCLEYQTCNAEYTPSFLAGLLDAVFDDFFNSVGCGGFCVVPLSGGWDSRIILGAILERFESSRIKTVSFGVPGQLDFDIGAQIAIAFGLEHHAVDLSAVELTWKNLLTSAKESPWTYVPDGYFNRLAISQVARSDKDVVLSGFMGDPLTGGHLSSATTQEEAIEEFVAKQRREKSLYLASTDYDPRSALPKLPERRPIPYSELLDFGIRQANCVAPIVTPQKHWSGWGAHMGQMPSTGATVLAPFVHPQWAAYWLQAPKGVKVAQKLYLEMMQHKFPKLAAIPSKYSLGSSTRLGHYAVRVRRRVQGCLDRALPRLGLRYRAGLNYLDYAAAFRKRDDYRAVLDQAVGYLKTNQTTPWLDLDRMKRHHMTYKVNHENAFLILIGLALNLEKEEST